MISGKVQPGEKETSELTQFRRGDRVLFVGNWPERNGQQAIVRQDFSLGSCVTVVRFDEDREDVGVYTKSLRLVFAVSDRSRLIHTVFRVVGSGVVGGLLGAVILFIARPFLPELPSWAIGVGSGALGALIGREIYWRLLA